MTANGIIVSGSFQVLKLICGYGVCLLLGMLSVTLLWLVWKDRIKLDDLIAEVNGQASVSRFQLVLFSMVIALGLFLLTIEGNQFPVISPQLLLLLGISASTYAVGKAISYSQPGVIAAPGEQQTVKEISATGAAVIATPDGIAAEGKPDPTPHLP